MARRIGLGAAVVAIALSLGALARADGPDPDQLKSEFQRHISASKEYGQQEIGKAQALLDDPANKAALGDDTVKQLQAQLDDAKKAIASAAADDEFKLVEKHLSKAEELLGAGKPKGRTSATPEHYLDLAEKQLAKCPQDDPRAKEYADRIAKDRDQASGKAAGEAHDAAVGATLKRWKEYSSKQGDGWEAETGPASWDEYAHHAPHSLQCPLTEKHAAAAQQFIRDRKVVDAATKYKDDPEVKAVLDDAQKAYGDCAQKLCGIAARLLGEAEKASEARPKDVEALLKEVEKHAQGTPQLAATQTRAKALLQKWEDAATAAGKAHDELVARCAAKAESLWPAYLKAYPGGVAIDPLECMKKIDDWKGKTILFENVSNRAGWSYDEGEYDVIVPVNGTPVALKYDAAVREQIDALEKQKVTADQASEPIEGMIAKVEGVCRVKEIEYSQIFQKYYTTAIYDAPLLRIVAIRVGPVAAAAGQESSLSDK